MTSQPIPGFGLKFFGMVGIIMGALKLKDRGDRYYQLPAEVDGRVALASPPAHRDNDYNEEAINYLDTEVQGIIKPERVVSKSCRVCCGLNCALFWKAFGMVVAVFALWNAFRLIKWTVSASPTGLELMPTYNTSLGCNTAPYIYNGSEITLNIPVGAKKADHAIDIRGAAVGTVGITKGFHNSTDVVYKMTIRTNSQALLQDIVLSLPMPDPETGSVQNSRVIISTPFSKPSAVSCIRYDITIFLPQNLRRLHVASHTTTHVRFNADADIVLDDLYVTLFALNTNNMILPHPHIMGRHMALEVYRGWIVGEVSVLNETIVTTQRGDGVTNIRVLPTVSDNEDSLGPLAPAFLQTVTGAGRTDIFYINNKANLHRPIRNLHLSALNADMFLTYREAEYNGLIELESKSYTATGVESSVAAPSRGDNRLETGLEHIYWVGNQNGGDQMLIKSRGWTGVYF